MKKIFVFSAFMLFASASIPSNHVEARDTSYLVLRSDGCYYKITEHSLLWGLITWETEKQVWCGPGFGLGW